MSFSDRQQEMLDQMSAKRERKNQARLAEKLATDQFHDAWAEQNNRQADLIRRIAAKISR
jgi:hypothetical protein